MVELNLNEIVYKDPQLENLLDRSVNHSLFRKDSHISLTKKPILIFKKFYFIMTDNLFIIDGINRFICFFFISFFNHNTCKKPSFKLTIT